MTATPSYESIADVEAAAQKMRDFFLTGATLDVDYRRQALAKLKAYLKANEERILSALTADLGKAPFEGYATELGLVYDEINTCLKHLNSWSKPRRVPTPIVHFHSTSKVHPSPLGVVLVLSPWNYPVQLALVPMVDAIAAGNCVALKPSRTSKATSALLIDMVAEIFPPEFVCGFPGSGEMNDWLLEVRWDQIFFTGSPNVGHTIMQAAAKFLTPVVLELGGKSPCIVDETANIKRAAQRIAWGKSINCGQTCVAPDYFLVHENVVDEFIPQLEACFHQYYGADILQCDEWPHMISRRHFDRVMGLIENRNPDARVAFGGHGDPETLRIEPTCLTGVTLDDPVMGEEIFGPVIPVPLARPGIRDRAAFREAARLLHLQRGQAGPAPRAHHPALRRRHRQRRGHPPGEQPHGIRRRGQLRHGRLPRQGGLRLLHALQVDAEEGHLDRDAHPQPPVRRQDQAAAHVDALNAPHATGYARRTA